MLKVDLSQHKPHDAQNVEDLRIKPQKVHP